jgi:hypothetical protein
MGLWDKDRIASPQTRRGVYAIERYLPNGYATLETAISSSSALTLISMTDNCKCHNRVDLPH